MNFTNEHRRTDRSINRQTNRQIDRQVNRRANRQAGRRNSRDESTRLKQVQLFHPIAATDTSTDEPGQDKTRQKAHKPLSQARQSLAKLSSRARPKPS